jgi:Gram-negative porin
MRRSGSPLTPYLQHEVDCNRISRYARGRFALSLAGLSLDTRKRGSEMKKKTWSMKKRSALLVALSIGAPAAAYADTSQMQAVYAYLGGLGPDILAVAPQQTLVTLYGTVDIGANYTKDGPYSIERVQSGGALTSKFGIYGQEYLGNQWTALFRLENGFLGNTGAVQDSTSLFNRASYVGLQNPQYGVLTMGRQYTRWAQIRFWLSRTSRYIPICSARRISVSARTAMRSGDCRTRCAIHLRGSGRSDSISAIR